MEFFDSLINDVLSSVEKLPLKRFSYDEGLKWNDVGYNQVILNRDSAFEMSGTGFNLVTSKEISDEIIVVGNELSDIKKNCSFARISIIQIKDEEDKQKTYNLIRKTEYVKYHFFPEGYMLRTSSRGHKEAVRVSVKALKDGISFYKTGNLLISKYKEIPSVLGVKVTFINSPEADYGSLEKTAEKANSITETFNHIMNSVKFDCDTCNLKPICDEIEGMKELHFGMKQ